MDKTLHSKTGLFLMELIIAILFFSISGAICVQLFVKAHILSEKSVDINNSCLWTQNVSETFCGYNGNLHEVAEFFSDSCIVLVSYEDNPEVGTLVMFFDADWNIIEYPSDDGALEDAEYELMLCISQLPAKEVYKDTSYDTFAMKGDALQGRIVVMDINAADTIDQLPRPDAPGIISDRTVDCYIGIEKEAEADE